MEWCRTILLQSRAMEGRVVALVSIQASRAVFASIEAAEIAGSNASPPMMARAGMRSGGQRLPSIRASVADMGSASTARRMASMVACRMLMVSISSTEAEGARSYFWVANRARPRRISRLSLLTMTFFSLSQHTGTVTRPVYLGSDFR